MDSTDSQIIKIDNGIASYTIPSTLEQGRYNLSVYYPGSEVYSSCIKQYKLYIQQKGVLFDTGNQTTLTAYVGEQIQPKVWCKSVNSDNSMDALNNALVSFYINGNMIGQARSDENGGVECPSYTINLDEGAYSIQVILEETTSYPSISTTIPLVVEKYTTTMTMEDCGVVKRGGILKVNGMISVPNGIHNDQVSIECRIANRYTLSKTITLTNNTSFSFEFTTTEGMTSEYPVQCVFKGNNKYKPCNARSSFYIQEQPNIILMEDYHSIPDTGMVIHGMVRDRYNNGYQPPERVNILIQVNHDTIFEQSVEVQTDGSFSFNYIPPQESEVHQRVLFRLPSTIKHTGYTLEKIFKIEIEPYLQYDATLETYYFGTEYKFIGTLLQKDEIQSNVTIKCYLVDKNKQNDTFLITMTTDNDGMFEFTPDETIFESLTNGGLYYLKFMIEPTDTIIKEYIKYVQLIIYDKLVCSSIDYTVQEEGINTYLNLNCTIIGTLNKDILVNTPITLSLKNEVYAFENLEWTHNKNVYNTRVLLNNPKYNGSGLLKIIVSQSNDIDNPYTSVIKTKQITIPENVEIKIHKRSNNTLSIDEIYSLTPLTNSVVTLGTTDQYFDYYIVNRDNPKELVTSGDVTFTHTFIPAEGTINTNITFAQLENIQTNNAVDITATLVDKDDNPLSDKIVLFFVDNTYIGGKPTDNDGEVSWKYTFTTGGTHTVMVRFDGTIDYISCKDVIEVTVDDVDITPEWYTPSNWTNIKSITDNKINITQTMAYFNQYSISKLKNKTVSCTLWKQSSDGRMFFGIYNPTNNKHIGYASENMGFGNGGKTTVINEEAGYIGTNVLWATCGVETTISITFDSNNMYLTYVLDGQSTPTTQRIPLGVINLSQYYLAFYDYMGKGLYVKDLEVI